MGAGPESWESLRARVSALLAAREALFDETAEAWVRFAHRQGWSRSDVEGLWEGLTEDLLRRGGQGPGGRADESRKEILTAMTALRERILGALERSVGNSGAGSVS